jgi:hypothetical protein
MSARRIFYTGRLSGYPVALPKPTKVYNTNLIWSGSKVLNPVAKTFREYMQCDDPASVILHELPFPNHISRIDYVDPVTVRVFSESMWAENDVLFIEAEPGSKPLPKGLLH